MQALNSHSCGRPSGGCNYPPVCRYPTCWCGVWEYWVSVPPTRVCLWFLVVPVFGGQRSFLVGSRFCFFVCLFWWLSVDSCDFSVLLRGGKLRVPLLCYPESESLSVVSDSLRPRGLYSPWSSPGQNTGVGSRSLLQGIFPTISIQFNSDNSIPRDWTQASHVAGRFFTS